MPDEIAPKSVSERMAAPELGSQLNAQGRDGQTITPIISQKITWQKITWQKTGHVAEPGRYMYRFGWLTVTADDIAVWRQYPHAEFTMLQLPKRPGAVSAEDALDDLDEYHLGTFELPRV